MMLEPLKQDTELLRDAETLQFLARTVPLGAGLATFEDNQSNRSSAELAGGAGENALFTDHILGSPAMKRLQRTTN